MCASECRFLTLLFVFLEKGDSSEGGVDEGDVGVLRPEENWDMNETTVRRRLAHPSQQQKIAAAKGKQKKRKKRGCSSMTRRICLLQQPCLSTHASESLGSAAPKQSSTTVTLVYTRATPQPARYFALQGSLCTAASSPMMPPSCRAMQAGV